MTSRLPNTRELPRRAAQTVTLGSIGTQLRAQYEGLRGEPMPDHLQTLVHQLADKDDSSGAEEPRPRS